MPLVPLLTHGSLKQNLWAPYFSTGQLNASTISTGAITANTAEISSLTANYVSSGILEAATGSFSTFSTSQIVIDSQTLNATPTELLLNGTPIATLSSLSSIADWSYEPALSTIQMAGNDLDQGGTLSSINVRAGNGFFLNLVAFNSLFVSSNTSTISSLIESAELGIMSTLNAGTISSGAISCASVTAPLGIVSSLVGDAAQFSTISCMTFESMLGNMSSLNVSGFISTPDIEVSTINGAQFGASSITIEVAGVSSLVANSISSVGAEIRQALMSSIVFSPSLNPSLGGVNVNLGLGGILGNVIGWGAGVFGAAAGAVGLVTGMTALATGRQTQNIDNSRYELVNGTTQLQFSTLGGAFSTIYRLNSSADPQRIPGEEILISTINPPGLAVRSISDPLYTLSTPSSTIQAFGEWVPVPDELVNVSTFATASISSLEVSSINGLNTASLENISTFNDLVASTIYTSSISTAYIYGANPNLFGIGIQGLEIQTAPTGQIWISSPQTNIAGLINCSSVGATNVSARNGGFSTIQVSSLTAEDVSTLVLHAGSGTLSSLVADSVTAGHLSTTSVSTAAVATSSLSINGVFVIPAAASFLSRSTQTVAANTPLVLYHEVAGASVGNSITQSTTAIVIGEAGVYDVFTSIQFDKSGLGVTPVDFWFRKNGVDIPDSASQIVVAGNNGETLGAVGIYETFAAGDKLEVVIASADNTLAATFFESTITTPYTRPAVPAIITNLKRLG